MREPQRVLGWFVLRRAGPKPKPKRRPREHHAGHHNSKHPRTNSAHASSTKRHALPDRARAWHRRVNSQLHNRPDFVGVPSHLQQHGYDVIAPRTAAFQSVDVRANQLKTLIETAYPDPATKVNLVAHSMGGLDCRYMIVHLGMAPRVASLTTISTPHYGTPISDVALGVLPGNAQQVIDNLLNVFNWDFDFVLNTSSDYMQNVFNPTTPDDPRVYYQSWAGQADPFKQTGARVRLIMVPFWGIIAAQAGANDSMIPVSSAQWGNFRGVINADHQAQVGFYDNPNSQSFDHKQFYLDMVEDLRARGY